MKALVLNYGVGNLFSISSALKRVGFDVRISSDLEYDYDLLVLPGVGSFKALGPYIEKKGDLLKDVINKISAVLGICLGMQILFEYSTEYGYSKGLGILEGYVERIITSRKLPHIGWDKVYLFNRNEKCKVFAELNGKYVYFVHSYVVYPRHLDSICMLSHYDMLFPAAIAYRNIFGTQFHPEKSGSTGKQLFEAIAQWIKR